MTPGVMELVVLVKVDTLLVADVPDEVVPSLAVEAAVVEVEMRAPMVGLSIAGSASGSATGPV